MTYIIPTIHPANLLRNPRPLIHEITTDLSKAWRVAMFGYEQPENLVVVHPSNPAGIEMTTRGALDWMRRWESLRCPIAVDIETSGLHLFNCKLFSIALSGADDHNTAVSFTLGDLHTMPWESEMALVGVLRRILASRDITKIFHNAPFDMAVLVGKRYEIGGPMEDTMAFAHIIQPDTYHDLGWVGHTYLDVEPWKLNHQTGKKQAQTEDVLELLIYNAKDALNTMKLREPMLREIAERGMNQQLIYYQCELARLAARMELWGVPVDHDLRKKRGDELLAELKQLEQELRDDLGWPDFNPMSKNHAVEAMYSSKYLGLTPKAWTEVTKQPSTKYADLIDYMDNPVVARFVKYTENRHVWATLFSPKGAFSRAIIGDRAYSKWNYAGTTGSRYSSMPNCYDAETEVLTELGWMKWPDALEQRPRIAQVLPNGGAVSFTDATFIQVPVDAGDKVVVFNQDGLDLRVTEDHRMLIWHKVQRDHKKVPRVEFMPAGSLTGPRRYTNPSVPKCGAVYMDGAKRIPWERIAVLCAAQADGWRRKYGKGEAWAWYFTKRRKIDRLVSALEQCGDDASWYIKPLPRPGRSAQSAIYLRDCPLKTWLDDTIGEHKRFGSWLLEWHNDSLRVFSDELTQWDGRADRRSEYSTTEECNADWAQIAAAISGAKTGDVRMFWGNQSKKPCYQVTAGRRNGRVGLSTKPGRRPHYQVLRSDELFYCATVPTGAIIVRRNGKVAVCGNCQNLRKKDRYFLRAPEGRVIIGSDKAALELRIVACLAGVPELVEEMRKPDGDPHRLAAMRVYGEAFLQKSPEEQQALRNGVKTTVYSMLYRGGIKTVHKTIRKNKRLPPEIRSALSLEAVTRIYHAYFGKYVQIPAWHDTNYELASSQGYLEIPPLGRRRYFPVHPPPYTEVANWPVQCCGSDVVGMQMVHLQYALDEQFRGTAYTIIHGHDAVYVECDAKDAEAVAAVVQREFGHFPLEGPIGTVDLSADIHISKSVALEKIWRR